MPRPDQPIAEVDRMGVASGPGAVADMAQAARETTQFLKSMANEARLLILCRLNEGPATVGELETLLGRRQSAVSQQLARLRAEGLVDFTREGRSIRYSIADDRTRRLMALLYEMFCR